MPKPFKNIFFFSSMLSSLNAIKIDFSTAELVFQQYMNFPQIKFFYSLTITLKPLKLFQILNSSAYSIVKPLMQDNFLKKRKEKNLL